MSVSNLDNTINHFCSVLKIDIGDFEHIIILIKKFFDIIPHKSNQDISPTSMQFFENLIKKSEDAHWFPNEQELYLYYRKFKKMLTIIRNFLLNHPDNEEVISYHSSSGKNWVISQCRCNEIFIEPALEKVNNRLANINSAYDQEDRNIVAKIKLCAKKYLDNVIDFEVFNSNIVKIETLGFLTESYALMSTIKKLLDLFKFIEQDLFKLCLAKLLAKSKFN